MRRQNTIFQNLRIFIEMYFQIKYFVIYIIIVKTLFFYPEYYFYTIFKQYNLKIIILAV